MENQKNQPPKKKKVDRYLWGIVNYSYSCQVNSQNSQILGVATIRKYAWFPVCTSSNKHSIRIQNIQQLFCVNAFTGRKNNDFKHLCHSLQKCSKEGSLPYIYSMFFHVEENLEGKVRIITGFRAWVDKCFCKNFSQVWTTTQGFIMNTLLLHA